MLDTWSEIMNAHSSDPAAAPMPNVLVVEDDPEVSSMVRLILESEGFIVTNAFNGHEALEEIKRELPDLILLDMKMPVMNGWQFARAFMAEHDHVVPIVVITAAEDAQRRAREVEAHAWIGKPFRMQELLEAVRRYAGRGPVQQDGAFSDMNDR
jgi:CheY-like chemotaxis protein